jgi:single-stranded DNA-binding protein
MTEPSVSFAGNLTDDPEVRYTESGIARGVPGGGVGPPGAGAVVLHRGCLAGSG